MVSHFRGCIFLVRHYLIRTFQTISGVEENLVDFFWDSNWHWIGFENFKKFPRVFSNKSPKVGGTFFVTQQHTPWKMNMEHTNHPFRKENDLPSPYDYVPAVNLQGCTKIIHPDFLWDQIGFIHPEAVTTCEYVKSWSRATGRKFFHIQEARWPLFRMDFGPLFWGGVDLRKIEVTGVLGICVYYIHPNWRNVTSKIVVGRRYLPF